MLHNPYSSDYFQVPHPQTPYYGDIPNGMSIGKQIFVSGTMHGDDFAINLLNGEGKAFHLNPRLHQHCVVRNAELHGGWGPEDRHGPMPFHHGQHFEVIIKCDHEYFLVAVNGQHCYEFHHRAAFDSISHLEVVGSVHLQKIVFSGGHGHRTHKHMPSNVPFSVPLAGVHDGKMIQIIGTVPDGCGRFAVNLQDGDGDAHNIALHFNARFDDPYDGRAVVVTNRSHGNWGSEIREHASAFPFHQGHQFEMLILYQHGEFKIAVNGHHFASMHARNSLHEANHLAVEGDCFIRSIREY